MRASSNGAIAGLAMFYGGLGQLLAGMWELRVGNTFAATILASYGGFWLSFAALNDVSMGFLVNYKRQSDLTSALGIYLFAWATFSLLMTIAAHRTTLGLVFMLFLVTLTFLLLSIAEFHQDVYCQRASGIIGIICSACAWYAAMAALLTKKTSFFTLPVGELDPIYKRLGWLKEE